MAGKKITELISGSLQNLPLSGVTTVVYSGTTFQHNLTDLREKLVDSGSHNFKGDQIITGSLTISGSHLFDLNIKGRQLITGPLDGHTPQLWISGSDANTVYGRYTTHIEFPGSGSSIISPGGATFIKPGTDSQLFEVYNNEGSIALRTDASGSYIADFNPNISNYSNAIKFQPLSNYQNGLVSILRNTDISGSLTSDNIVVGPISEVLSGSQYTAAHIATSNSINIVHFEGNDPYYSQVNITNTNSGNNASSDLVLTADNGNETVHFVDLGINSSTYTGGLVGRENDAYLLNVGKDLYIGTVGGTNHPAKLYLFAENNWENPQITIHTGSQVTFNTSGYTDGFLYEFSGSVKLQDELKVDGSVTSSYFVGDGSQLTNLPIQTTDVSMFLSSSTFNSFTQSVDGRLDSLESVTSSYFTFNENTMSMVTGENMIFQTSYSGTVIGTATETATDSQGGQDTITFAAWIEGSGGTDYPTIVNVQPNWKASGPGLSVGATVASVNTLVFSPGQSVYQITLNSGYGLFQTSQTYTFTEPDTSGTITKNWVFESGSNLIVPSGGNVIGAQNLATTGSNIFVGDQTINGSLIIEGVSEILTVDGGFNGNRTFDYTSGSIFYLTGLTGNGVWNIENVPTTNNRAIALTYIINQGVSPYSGSQYQINGSNVTVKWVDSTIPTGSANKTEIIGLTAFRVSSTWDVIGSLSTFGI